MNEKLQAIDEKYIEKLSANNKILLALHAKGL